MTSIKKICVFCGSSDGVDDSYGAAARSLGTLIGEKDFELVYGGAKIGLMGMIADSALEHGADVTGVIPETLKRVELVHEGLSTLHTTQTMQERQKMMADLSDAFVVLPGGMGTLAELFEVLTWKQLSLHNKPIFILNINGYWDHLLRMLDDITNQGFMHGEIYKLCQVVEGISDLENYFVRQ